MGTGVPVTAAIASAIFCTVNGRITMVVFGKVLINSISVIGILVPMITALA